MSEISTKKLYIGSLSRTIDESYLQKVLNEKSVPFTRIEFTNNGYAFADLEHACGSIDQIIRNLDGMELDGQSIKVELSTSKLAKRKVKNNKVVVHNFPDYLHPDDVKDFLRSHCSKNGSVKQCDKANNKMPSKASFIVQLSSMDDAERLLDKVNGLQYGDSQLKVVPFSENHVRRVKNGGVVPNATTPIYPFRFLIPTNLVGAVIGVNGSTVKKFQVESGARYIIVDVQQRDERYPYEKPVTILGSADSQMTALRSILKFLDELLIARSSESKNGDESITNGVEESDIMKHSDSNNNVESSSDSGKFSPDVTKNPNSKKQQMINNQTIFKAPLPVRILTHDHLVGRLIGKGGSNLAGIKLDTDTKITIPSTAERHTFRAGLRDNGDERIITIEGHREKTVQAAESMLCKLRSSYDKDMDYIMRQQENMQSLYPGAYGMGGFMGTPLTPVLTSPTNASHVPHELLNGAGAAGLPRMTNISAAMPAAMVAAGLANPAVQQTPLFSPIATSPPAGIPNSFGIPAPMSANSLYEPLQSFETNYQETTYVYIHHGAVGAIIGNRGTNIHMIKQLSQAQVTVDTQSDHQDQRRITIVGTPDAQWKAQWLIIEKLRSDGFTQGEWPILTIEIPIPMAMVGRIIGKQGKKVLELQRESHAIIEVPMTGTVSAASTTPVTSSAAAAGRTTPANATGASGDDGSQCNTSGGQASVSNNTTPNGTKLSSDSNEIMLVKVLGHFWALQSAQRKIRSIVNRNKTPTVGSMPSQMNGAALQQPMVASPMFTADGQQMAGKFSTLQAAMSNQLYYPTAGGPLGAPQHPSGMAAMHLAALQLGTTPMPPNGLHLQPPNKFDDNNNNSSHTNHVTKY